jgi:hypothetical protein
MKVAVKKEFFKGFVKECYDKGFNELQTSQLLEIHLRKQQEQKNK